MEDLFQDEAVHARRAVGCAIAKTMESRPSKRQDSEGFGALRGVVFERSIEGAELFLRDQG